MSVISSATTFLKVAFVLTRFLLRQLLSFLAILFGISKSGKKKNNVLLSQEQGYAPVGDELNPICNLNSEKLPNDLPNGMYIRNGPNPQHPPRGDYHLFEGDGMLHGAIVSDGNVRYTNRYVKTEKYEMEKEFEEPILWGFFYRVNPFVQLHYWYLQHLRGVAGIPSGNAGNTNLVYHANTCLALYEGGLPYEIELPSLETVNNEKRNMENGYFAKNAGIYHDSRRCYTFKGQWKFTTFTAHPKVDPDNHEMVTFGYLGTQMPYLHYGVVDKSGEVVHQVTFDNEQDDMILLMKGPSMLHDIAITKNYTIMMLFPLYFDKKLVIDKRLPFQLDKSTKSVFAIIPRYYKKGQDKIKVFQADPCYVFHVFGAFESGNKVVLRGCRINDIDIELKSLSVEESVVEWTFDMDTLETKETSIKFDTKEGAKSINCDFPQIHPSLTGKPFRYGYAVSTDVGGGGNPQLHKVDFDTKSAVTMTFEKHHLIGEHAVVPKTNGKEEDDVYLLSFSTDVKHHKSYFEVIDGKTMTLVRRIELPRQIARGFHGIWVNESDYNQSNKTAPVTVTATTTVTEKEEEEETTTLLPTVTEAESKLEEQLTEESLSTVVQNAQE